MSYGEAIFLGAIQGLTEFLPISSSGHLALLQSLLHYDPKSPEMLAFTAVGHVGTLLAVLVVFRTSIARALARRRHTPRILGLAMVATVVTAAIALPLRAELKALFSMTHIIGVALCITGAVLFLPSRMQHPRKGWRQFSWSAAAVVGLSQALALVPGISRSGMTICTAEILGLRRRWAAEFSFLIAAPAILGVTVLALAEFLEGDARLVASNLVPIAVGGLIAAGVGYVALRVLLKMVQRARLHWFSYYVWALGLYVILNVWLKG